jgi:hypothetical protein
MTTVFAKTLDLGQQLALLLLLKRGCNELSAVEALTTAADFGEARETLGSLEELVGFGGVIVGPVALL